MFHKLNIKFPKELKDQILNSGLVEIIKNLNHPSTAIVAKERGIWPNTAAYVDNTVEEYLPGLTAKIHKLYFGEDAKPEDLGEVRFFWGIGGADAFQPPHKDGLRTSTFNTNLIGCNGMEVKMFRDLAPVNEALSTTLDKVEEIGSYVMGDDDVWLQDTTTTHFVPTEYWVNRFVLILMYSWYDGDFVQTHGYDVLHKKLAENNMLAATNGSGDNQPNLFNIDYSYMGGPPKGDPLTDGHFLVISWKEKEGKKRSHLTWAGAFQTAEEAEETAKKKIQVGHPKVYSRHSTVNRDTQWPLKSYEVVKGFEAFKAALRRADPNIYTNNIGINWLNY